MPIKEFIGKHPTGPSPSCPCTLRPAMYTRPEAVTRAEWPHPATTCTTSSSMLSGRDEGGSEGGGGCEDDDDDDDDDDDAPLLL